MEEAVILGRGAAELCPSGHADRGVSLYNLACDLRKRSAKKATICYLEEAIELLCLAVELRPSGHPDRPPTLCELALCLSNRHDERGLIDDLGEAITLGSAALELCPPGHPDRGAVLYNLTCDLWKKFQKQADMPSWISVAHSTSKADFVSSLLELSLHLRDRYQKQAT